MSFGVPKPATYRRIKTGHQVGVIGWTIGSNWLKQVNCFGFDVAMDITAGVHEIERLGDGGEPDVEHPG